MTLYDIPSPGRACFADEIGNRTTRFLTVADAGRDFFDSYTEKLIAAGFVLREERTQGQNRFRAFSSGEDAVFLNDFGGIDEARIVVETGSRYFSYADRAGEPVYAPQITQIALTDFGLSYAVRLADGRFIVFDGGREREADARSLMNCLLAGTPEGKKPVIAAWILTHPHSDHYPCMIRFVDLFGGEVTVEKVLFNFPESDDVKHYPELDEDQPDGRDSVNLPRLMERIARLGAEIYQPHTGQVYRIGGAVCEILASMDDTLHLSDNVNSASLMIRMELGGQVILWATDGNCRRTKLAQRYGEYLKSDILQVPHHGFGSGSTEAQIACYRLIRPDICLIPVSDYNAYSFFDCFVDGTKFLMSKMGVREIITGSTERTLVLPYTPPEWGAEVVLRDYSDAMARAGSSCWIFSGLDGGSDTDRTFTVLNTAFCRAEIRVEIYPEGKRLPMPLVAGFTANGGCLTTIRLSAQPEEGCVNCDLPDGVFSAGHPFAVRFTSKTPVVVTNAVHPAAHKGADGQ